MASEATITRGVTEVGISLQRFCWPDYVVFIFTLLICVTVGIYYGFIKVSNTTQDYLVGGRNMRVFPISMSLIASYISGISLLGIPTEVYLYGIQYIYILGGIVFMAIIMQFIYMPVFHDMKLTSTFEYLERRFNRKIRLFGAILSLIGAITWLPIVIYVPALAFNQVTGINIHLVTPLVCLICIFYTCVGGIRAVVWTDVIQTILMFGSMILIITKGTIDVGGAEVVWKRNWESDRIEGPNFDMSLFSRHTVWSLVFGGSVYWLQSSSVNQSMIQRYLALPTLKAAKCALWVFVLGVFMLTIVCVYAGLLIYATYSDCDPITTKLAKEKDQLLPLLVMEVLGSIPGFTGLFIAGIFSASLSSLSTGLNSLSAIILEDFYKPRFTRKLSERHEQIVLKSVVVIFGVLFVTLVQVVEKLGTVLQLVMSVGAISAGPALSLFTMGVLLPWVNSTGVMCGGLASLAFMAWLCVNAQRALVSGDLSFPEKNVSTHACDYHFMSPSIPSNEAINLADIQHTDELFMLYRLSYLWYTLIGLIVSVIVGLIVSLLLKPNDPRDVNPNLLAPPVRRFITPRKYPNQPESPDRPILAYQPSVFNDEMLKDGSSLKTHETKT